MTASSAASALPIDSEHDEGPLPRPCIRKGNGPKPCGSGPLYFSWHSVACFQKLLLEAVVDGIVAKPDGEHGVVERAAAADGLAHGLVIQMDRGSLVGRIVEVDDVARFNVADRPHEAAQGLKFGGNRLFLGRLEVRLDAVVERVDEARAGDVAQQAETHAGGAVLGHGLGVPAGGRLQVEPCRVDLEEDFRAKARTVEQKLLAVDVRLRLVGDGFDLEGLAGEGGAERERHAGGRGQSLENAGHGLP